MAAFSYHHQYHPLLLHPAYLPSSPCTEMTNSSSSTCLILQHNNPSSIAIPNPSESEAMPSFESSSGSGSSLGSVRVALPVVSGTGTQMNSNGGQEQLPPTPQASMEKKKKKRKSRDCTSLCSAQPKDAKGKSRKQKEQAEEKKVEADDGKGEAKPSDQEPPKGYIHVRARRGQATDSHSLAERVRREKIRERMDLLQGLVPGCDKITGKALMLDEIINYVQSLQNQVEFLSMKLASMNPMLYDFGFHLDGHTDHQPQTMGSMTQGSLTVPSVLQTSTPIYHHTALEDATCRNYPMMETSTPLLLHGQGSIALPPQDNGSVLMQVADKRQELLNQAVFNNMCSFQ